METQEPKPRGGQRKYPDFTEAQKQLLRQITETPSYRHTNGGIAWRKALRDHPEWKEELLTKDGRPEYVLWHVAKALKNGITPDRPFYKSSYKRRRKKRNVELVVVNKSDGRGKWKRKKKAWWIEKGLPHPGSPEAKRIKAATTVTPVAMPVVSNFCPACGAHKSHFGNRA